jgi:hypothetical protein
MLGRATARSKAVTQAREPPSSRKTAAAGVAHASATESARSGNGQRRQERHRPPERAERTTAAHDDVDAEVLCILRNSLAEAISLRVHARTPAGGSFLHDAEADVEPGGHMAFVAALCNEPEIWSEYGRMELHFERGRPSLHPREGTEQVAQKMSSSSGFPAWVLTCSIVASPQQLSIVQPQDTIPEVLASAPDLRTFASLWHAANVEASEEETVIALEDESITQEIRGLLREPGGFDHVRIPCAIFVTQHGGHATMKDGASLQVRPDDASNAIFEIAAQGAWPALRVVASRQGQRVRKRWQLVYSSRVIL